MDLYIAVFIGVIIYLGFSLNDGLVKPDFAWPIFWKQNLPVAILNLICGYVLVWQRAAFAEILPITGLIAVFIGYTGQSVLKKVFKSFDSRFKTYVGNNTEK